MKLTITSVRSLTLPKGRMDKTYFDDDLPGFGIRVRAGGSKTWVVQYKVGARNRRMMVGSVGTLDLSKARATAKDLLAAVRLGRDPFAEKIETRAKIAETFGALLPRYLARQRARLKPRTLQETERHLQVHARSLHCRAVHAIDRRAVAALLAEIAETSGPVAANRVRASLSAYCNWLLREGLLLDLNPVSYTNRQPEKGVRERVLKAEEILEIWHALEHDQYGNIVRLLALTGARRDEIGGLRWSEVDLKRALITLPGERTKNKRPHDIPLSSAALAILVAQPRRLQPDGSSRDHIFGFGTRGFSGWSKAKRELDERLLRSTNDPFKSDPMPPWRLHDLRRTLSTMMHDQLGIMPHVVEAVLGHVDGHRRGVAGVYNRAAYANQKAEALEQWADHLGAIVTGVEKLQITRLQHGA
jgi:integrase